MSEHSQRHVTVTTTNEGWFAQLERSHPEFAAMLRARERESTHRLIRVRYSYAERCIAGGRAQLPESCLAREERGLYASVCPDGQVPLMVVADRTMEVTRDILPVTAGAAPRVGSYSPIAVRYPGDLIGVFEVTDRLTGVRQPESPWSVWAGSCSACIVGMQGRMITDIAKNLRVDHKQHDVQFIKSLATALECEWAAHVIIVPEAWLDTGSAAGRAIGTYAQSVAWKQARGELSTAAARARALELVGRSRALQLAVECCSSAAIIAERIHLITSVSKGERPCYSPLTGPTTKSRAADDLSGPFQAVLSKLWAHGVASPSEDLPAQRLVSGATRGTARFPKSIDWPTAHDSRYVLPVILGPVHLREVGHAGWITLNYPLFPEIYDDSTRQDPLERTARKGASPAQQAKQLITSMIEEDMAAIARNESTEWSATLDFTGVRVAFDPKNMFQPKAQDTKLGKQVIDRTKHTMIEAKPCFLLGYPEFQQLGWSTSGTVPTAEQLRWFQSSIRVTRK